jgi:hypothetical protein
MAPWSERHWRILAAISGLSRGNVAKKQVGVPGQHLGSASHRQIGPQLEGCCPKQVAVVLSTTTVAPVRLRPRIARSRMYFARSGVVIGGYYAASGVWTFSCDR